MDVRYINPFVEGVGSVFHTMLGLEPKRCKIELGTGPGNGEALVTSLIGISGQHVQGVVVLRFPPATALELAGRMLGTKLAELNEEVVDAISEIVNMVAGSAKAKLQSDPPLELGLPTVVQGRDYRVRYPSKSVWIEVPFESQAGNFSMELTLETK